VSTFCSTGGVGRDDKAMPARMSFFVGEHGLARAIGPSGPVWRSVRTRGSLFKAGILEEILLRGDAGRGGKQTRR
jgi:hypothetical protein